MPEKGTKLVKGKPLPPKAEVEAWVSEQVNQDSSWAIEVIETVFYEEGSSVIAERSLDRFEDPKEYRSALWDLYEEDLVRTHTIQGYNERGAPWRFHHWYIDFPGQKVVQVNGDRDT